MTRYISDDITRAEKQGFSSPDASWFKGESIDFVRRKLVDGNAQLYGFMDRDTVVHLVDEHLTGQQNRRLFIWSLINVEEWMERTL